MTQRSRNYVFTWNNYPDDYHVLLGAIECSYLVAGREVAPETGTPHLQGFVRFRSMKSVAQVISVLPGCHVERARGTLEQGIAYAKKDGDFVEFGVLPTTPVQRGAIERERYKVAYEAAKRGDFDTIDADILIRHYSSVKRICYDSLPPLTDLSGTCGYWIHGPSGCGKSTIARELFPVAYFKPINKWWDGFDREPAVIVDDVDPSHRAWIGYFLKVWADRFSFIAERKGGAQRIRPQAVVVTSQYTIGQIFSDVETSSALERRFKCWEYSVVSRPVFTLVEYKV